MARKIYCLDTSVLIDNYKSIEILRNGEENIIMLSHETLIELDKHKKTSRISHIVKEIVDELNLFKEDIIILNNENSRQIHDNKILDDILFYLHNNYDKQYPFIFVTNDKILSLRAYFLGIQTQEFKESFPYQSESQSYTGFVNYNDEMINNCFYWDEQNCLTYFTEGQHKKINFQNDMWNIIPKTPYQNAAMELFLNPKLDIISIQSLPGFGKTFLSLAAALYWTFQKKQFHKIFIFKNHIDVGEEKLGYLPGDIDEKVAPYFRPIYDLLLKLHKIRDANRLFIDPKSPNLEINKNILEFLPVNFIRGMNIDNSFVIIDECQNFSRHELKVILSRMGENNKVICLGDVDQIDNPYLNKFNNGLNWITKLFKNHKNYGHIVLKGKTSRGKIADMTREVGL